VDWQCCVDRHLFARHSNKDTGTVSVGELVRGFYDSFGTGRLEYLIRPGCAHDVADHASHVGNLGTVDAMARARGPLRAYDRANRQL